MNDRIPRRLRRIGVAVMLLGVVGCATNGSNYGGSATGGGTRMTMDTAEIPPATLPRRPVEGLLEDASEALRLANAAQEAGDPAEARYQYTLMLELLIEADLDPGVFYALREPLGNIVDTSVRHAALYPQVTPDAAGIDLDGMVYPEEDGIHIPAPLPYRIVREIERIQNEYPSAFQRGLDRSQKYLPYIEAEFEKADLPKDLAWLAIVESNFWPTAVSRSSAGGMWQFMKGTALQYKLRVDGHSDTWVDERYDWQSATRAAVSYLAFLRDTFDGDWALAVTAYNAGPGTLERAIAANGGQRNLWALIETPPASNRIHLEGKQYYPKFLASLIVAKNPAQYGFSLSPLPADNTVKVPVKGMYGLSDLDSAMGYPRGTLAGFNPDLLKEVTPPEHTGAYNISIPQTDRRKFQSVLKKVKPLKYGNLRHRVARGDTFSGIASRYRVSWRSLMRLNGYTSAKSLRVGKTLRIPGYNVASGESAPAPSITGSAVTYTVRRGDTLYDIAKLQGVGIKDLQAWNNMGGATRLNPGQKLRVRASTAAAASTSGGASIQAKHHIVRASEYPGKIARNYGIKLNDFLKWNNLNSRSKIYVGQRVIVGGSVGSSGAAPARPSTVRKVVHTVQRGDTAGGIARKYGVSLSGLLSWNKLTKSSTLHIGDQLVVQLPEAKSAAPPVSASAAEKKIHVVRSGQNPTTIAKVNGVKVDDLFKWNKWAEGHVLHIGDEVVLYRN